FSSRVLCARFFVVFFFSSRRRHTRFSRDWSSDVCSSDLHAISVEAATTATNHPDFIPDLSVHRQRITYADKWDAVHSQGDWQGRSEERRVGKSVDIGGRRIIKKAKTGSLPGLGTQ